MTGKQLFKQISYNKRGDILEVKLRDGHWNTYYKKEANIRSAREMRELVNDLKSKGVSFPTGWFD